MDLSELKQILQCAICLNTVSNPKELCCHHSYCKRCLDNLLKFSEDGHASIKCPKGCKKITKLSSTQTTEDLGVDYMLKGILEKLTAQEDKDEGDRITCGSCTKDVTKYCVKCKMLRCDSCPDEHRLDTVKFCSLPVNRWKNHFFPVKFDMQEKKLVPFCQEHSTEASFVFMYTTFICVYCVNRRYRGQHYATLDAVETTLKKVLNKQIDFKENLNARLKKTKKEISSVKCNLDEVLKICKLKRINDYVAFLNTEEENIKNVFSELAAEHIKQFDVQESTDYCKECLPKKGMDLLLRIEDILSEMSDTEMIDKVSVSLTYSNREKHPLGCLDVMHGQSRSMDTDARTFKSKICTPDGEHPSMISSLENLRDVLRHFDESNVQDDVLEQFTSIAEGVRKKRRKKH